MDDVSEAVDKVLVLVDKAREECEEAVHLARKARMLHCREELESERQWLESWTAKVPMAAQLSADDDEESGCWTLQQAWAVPALHMERVLHIDCSCGDDDVAVIASSSDDGTVVVQAMVDENGQPGVDQPMVLGFLSSSDGKPLKATTFIPALDFEAGWLVAAGGDSSEVGIFSVTASTSEQIHSLIIRDGWIVDMSVHELTLAAAATRHVEVWDLERAEPTARLPHHGLLSGLRMLDGNVVASLSWEAAHTMLIWDIRQPKYTVRMPLALANGTQTACFDAIVRHNAVGSALLAAASGSSVQVWDMRQALRPMWNTDALPLQGDSSGVVSLALDSRDDLMALGVMGHEGPAETGQILLGDLRHCCFQQVPAPESCARALFWGPPSAAGGVGKHCGSKTEQCFSALVMGHSDASLRCFTPSHLEEA